MAISDDKVLDALLDMQRAMGEHRAEALKGQSEIKSLMSEGFRKVEADLVLTRARITSVEEKLAPPREPPGASAGGRLAAVADKVAQATLGDPKVVAVLLALLFGGGTISVAMVRDALSPASAADKAPDEADRVVEQNP